MVGPAKNLTLWGVVPSLLHTPKFLMEDLSMSSDTLLNVHPVNNPFRLPLSAERRRVLLEAAWSSCLMPQDREPRTDRSLERLDEFVY